MRKTATFGILITVILLLSACATTSTVYPKGSDTYQVVSLSRYEQSSSQDAMKKANQTCASKGRETVVDNVQTIYQGVDKNLVLATDFARNVMSTSQLNMNTVQIGTIPDVRENSDYKTVIDFHCDDKS